MVCSVILTKWGTLILILTHVLIWVNFKRLPCHYCHLVSALSVFCQRIGHILNVCVQKNTHVIFQLQHRGMVSSRIVNVTGKKRFALY